MSPMKARFQELLEQNNKLNQKNSDLKSERNNLLQALSQPISNPTTHEEVIVIKTKLEALITAATNDGTISPDDANDIKSYILDKISDTADIITKQDTVIDSLTNDISCFTTRCMFSWLFVFVSGCVVLLLGRNCVKYVIKVNTFTPESVMVLDGNAPLADDAPLVDDAPLSDGRNKCQLLIENKKGERETISIPNYSTPDACNAHIQSILNKPIKIYYDDSSQIIYPIEDVTKTLCKKFAMLFIAIFVFYLIYKKNLSHNVNAITPR